MAATIEFDRKCIPSSEYVVLRLIDRQDEMKIGGIMICQSSFANDRLAYYQVEEVGKKAFEEYGLVKGDYVVADRLAQCYPTTPVAVMKYVNVIAKTNKERSQFSPLKNMVFVRDKHGETENVDGILVNNYDKKLNIGEVVSMNIDSSIEVPFKKGDKVMLSKGGDSVSLGTEHIYIYKYDMIACVVKE